MYGVFDEIRGALKLDSIVVDSNVFKLHYKATVFILLAGSVLLTQRQYFGDPIDCIVDVVDADIMDTYCWIHATHTIPALTGAEVGKVVAHPGVGPHVINNEVQEVRHHKYYQWVTLMLVLQALLFYAPKYLWKVWEGGKVKTLVMQLDQPIVEEEVKKERKAMLVSFFKLNLGRQNLYAFKYLVCEFLNFVNVVGQIYLTDSFLGNTFTTYGRNVLEFGKQEIGSRHDPMDEVFPKVAKCTFYKYGGSGSQETHDGLCVLPLNIINEKIYVFLWFWFITLAVITAFGLVYRSLTFLPWFRKRLLMVRSRLASSASVGNVASKFDVGDWFLLYQLSKNLDPLIYKEFVEELSKELQN